LNEQKPVPGEDQGLTVNAAHIIIPGVADVVVASSESDIFNCPRPGGGGVRLPGTSGP